jgi:LIM domain kinase 1
MAPEIAMGEDFDCAADIFSFGILLCEMITNREPSDTFLKRRAKELFALNEEELRSAIPEDCPESLEALTLQCCDLDPLKRPSAEGCVDWLQVSCVILNVCLLKKF